MNTTNPYLDTSTVPNTTKVFERGMWKCQVIFLWTGKPPFEDSHYCAPIAGEIEEDQYTLDIIDMMRGRGLQDPEANKFYGSLAGFEIRTPDGRSFRYLRPHIAAQEAQRIPATLPRGAPLAENRVDYTKVDWGKTNAEIARELGRRRQTIADARKRHAQ